MICFPALFINTKPFFLVPCGTQGLGQPHSCTKQWLTALSIKGLTSSWFQRHQRNFKTLASSALPVHTLIHRLISLHTHTVHTSLYTHSSDVNYLLYILEEASSSLNNGIAMKQGNETIMRDRRALHLQRYGTSFSWISTSCTRHETLCSFL